MDYYPDWLGRDLLEDRFPWDETETLRLDHFLEEYSVHDSYWIGLYLKPQRDATLLPLARESAGPSRASTTW